MSEGENTFTTPNNSIIYSQHLVAWSIKNFTELIQQYELIESVVFPLSKTELIWQLQFYKRENEKYTKIVGCGLSLKSNVEIKVHYKSSVLNYKGKSILETEDSLVPNDDFEPVFEFLQTDFDKFKNELWPNDTLTIVLNITLAEDKVETIVQLNEFGSLLFSEQFTDLTIYIGQQQIKVHRIILAVRSEYFNELLQDNRNFIVIDDNLNEHIFRIILQYIYSCIIVTSDLNSNVLELFNAANKFQLHELKLICETRLSETLSIESAADTLLLAHNNAALNLKTTAKQFIITHFGYVELTKAWTNLVESNSKLVIEMFSENLKGFY